VDRLPNFGLHAGRISHGTQAAHRRGDTGARQVNYLGRTFTPEFKEDALRFAVEEGKGLSEMAAHLATVRSQRP